MNLNEIWRENTAQFAPYPALIYEGKEYTNVQCDRLSSQLAHALRDLGITKGDRVAVTLPNCPEVIIAFGGINKASAVAVPVMPLLQAQEVHFILENCRPGVVLTDDMLLSKVKEAAKDLPESPEIFTLNGTGAPNSLREGMARQPEMPPEIFRGSWRVIFNENSAA